MNRKILIFTDSYPYGKSEQFLENELAFFVNSFDTVNLFPLEKGRSGEVRKTAGKISVLAPPYISIKNKTELLIKGLFNRSIFLPFLEEGIKSSVWSSITRFRSWFIHLLLIRYLLSAIKGNKLQNLFNEYDVLYFYWGLRWSQIIPFLPDGISSKIVVRFHGSDLYEETNGGYIPWRHNQISGIDHVLTVSETGKKYFEIHYGELRNDITISRIGTKDYGLNPYIKSDLTRIVSCSNLLPVKRVDRIVRTLGYIKTRVEWVHFGDGPQRKEIEELIAGLPENISYRLAGAVTHEDLMSFYRTNSVDLFINLSSSEGVPVSVMESMSFGIPVIATDVGGTAEIVSEKNGFLVEPDFSPEELAGKIIKLSERDDFEGLRKASREEWSLKSNAETVYPPFINLLKNI